eukprot:scaffold10571_cov154-Cylindrotheca_fusiformis.AAC.7
MAEAMLDENYKSSFCNRHDEDERGKRHALQIQEIPQENHGDKRVAIRIPPKRRKVTSCLAPKAIVEALNNSVTRQERLAAIDIALSSFDHQNQKLHDTEIEENSDIALVRMLVFLEFKTNFRRPPIRADMAAITTEICMTCEALEMVYRASSEAVGKSFERVGVDLLQILVILIDEEVKARFELPLMTTPAEALQNQSHPKISCESDSRSVTPTSGSETAGIPSLLPGYQQDDRNILLKNATKILGHYARVITATKTIAHFPGLLGSTLNLINMPQRTIPWESRLSCMWTIANLACDVENMSLMMVCPGLVNSLVSVGFQPMESSSTLERTMEVLRARSIATRALLNLSWPDGHKILLSEDVQLVKLLCYLAVERNAPFRNSRTVQDVMAQTRRNSLGALRNLAAAPRRYKIRICSYDDGNILDVLADAALKDSDHRVIDLAYATIHNLAIHDNACPMADRAPVVLALENALQSEDKSIRSHASAIRLVLERSITSDMPSYPKIQSLLEKVN